MPQVSRGQAHFNTLMSLAELSHTMNGDGFYRNGQCANEKGEWMTYSTRAKSFKGKKHDSKKDKQQTQSIGDMLYDRTSAVVTMEDNMNGPQQPAAPAPIPQVPAAQLPTQQPPADPAPAPQVPESPSPTSQTAAVPTPSASAPAPQSASAQTSATRSRPPVSPSPQSNTVPVTVHQTPSVPVNPVQININVNTNSTNSTSENVTVNVFAPAPQVYAVASTAPQPLVAPPAPRPPEVTTPTPSPHPSRRSTR